MLSKGNKLRVIGNLDIYYVPKQYRWAILYRDTFTPVLFVKVSEANITYRISSSSTLVSSPASSGASSSTLVFCKLLQYHYFTHEIVFHA